MRRNYEEEEIDPIKWSPGADIYSSYWVARQNKHSRGLDKMNDKRLAHIVLGPDLITEYPNRPVVVKNAKPLRNRPVVMKPERWKPDKSPRKLNKERKYSFTMDNGATMDFCLCPAGEFDMSNVDGQAKRFHRVKLTRPFLISKYNVTAAQWRDYGKYDCEGVPRELENLFAMDKLPVCVKRNYVQWCRFCDYITKRYRAIIPDGYVLRLPTEAELEWAMVADGNSTVANLDWARFDDYMQGWRDVLAKMLDKKRFHDASHFNTTGWYRSCYVGGRTCPNKWGFCDMRMDKLCLEWLDVDIQNRMPAQDLIYEEVAVDPLRWDGRYGCQPLVRNGRAARVFGAYSWWKVVSMAHVVIGPDLLKERQQKEEGPYPEEDFGGNFVGDMAKVVDMSSTLSHPANSPERHKLLLSRENTIVRSRDNGEDLRGCHTRKEKSPWVQIELDAPVVLSGIQVDLFRDCHHARHLRIWVSDGGKEMKEIASEFRQLRRYRFDLRDRNIKAKYIRIGREPGFIDEYFALNKVLIYGKKNGQ